MERNKIWKEILSLPEGKQFLGGTLVALVTLAGVIVVLFFRMEGYRKECQDKIEAKDATFLKFVIEANQRSERTRDKMDSINLELFNIKK